MDDQLDLGTSAVPRVFFLGLVGFGDAERDLIASQINAMTIGGLAWKVGPFASADAWLASGPRTRLLSTDEVEVEAGAEVGDSIRLWLPELDRPIAFSQPLTSEEFEPALTFDMSTSSLGTVLGKFSHWLHPKATLLYLTDLLTQNSARMRRSRVYHVLANHRLVAVVDLKASTGVLPEATMAEIASATWVPRPETADFIPEKFVKRATRELLWEYAGRTERDLLPDRYRSAPVFLRGAPQVPQRLLSDAHLFILRELAMGPRTYDQLCERGSFGRDEIGRALGAFYLVRSVTSSPEAGAVTQRPDSQTSTWPWFVCAQADGSAEDVTAPSSLTAHPPLDASAGGE